MKIFLLIVSIVAALVVIKVIIVVWQKIAIRNTFNMLVAWGFIRIDDQGCVFPTDFGKEFETAPKWKRIEMCEANGIPLEMADDLLAILPK